MKKILTLFAILFTLYASGQTIIGRQTAITTPINASGSLSNALLWLPDNYNSTSETYPLIIFLHGAGETGTGVSGLNNLIKTALPQRIAQGFNVTAVNPVDKKTYKFIVVSPQAPSWSYSYTHIKYILPYLISKYRVDINRIYITGLSAGGAGTWSSLSNDDNFTKKFAAAVTMSSADVSTSTEDNNIRWIGSRNDVKVWSIAGDNDPLYNISVDYTNRINNSSPAPAVPAKLTTLAGVGHSAWNQGYDPSWKVNGMNIYEWMLQYSRGTSVPPPPPPPVNQAPVGKAGSDISITLPLNSVNLTGSGSDADGTIASYNWSKIAGPTQFYISNTNISNPVISNLVSGNYTFRLTVTDNQGAPSFDDINIVVNAATGKPVVNAGSDMVITLPTNSVSLTGSASVTGGNIISYLWTKISGPTQFTINNAALPQIVVNNLVTGVYTFELKATDNKNAIARDSIKVTVNQAIPNGTGSGLIKVNVFAGDGPYNADGWNNWNVESSANNTNISSGLLKYDNGKVSTIAAILSHNQAVVDNYSNYPSTMIPAAVLRFTSYSESNRTLTIKGLSVGKKYSLEFYASRNANSGNSTQFKSGNSSATVATYNNASNKAVLTSLSPDANGQLLVNINKVNAYNYLNGFVITEEAGAEVASRSMSTTSAQVETIADEKLLEKTALLGIYPNPVTDQFTVEVNNQHIGKMKIQIIDLSGNIKYESLTGKNSQLVRQNLSAKNLSAGTYILRVIVGEWVETRKFLKL